MEFRPHSYAVTSCLSSGLICTQQTAHLTPVGVIIAKLSEAGSTPNPSTFSTVYVRGVARKPQQVRSRKKARHYMYNDSSTFCTPTSPGGAPMTSIDRHAQTKPFVTRRWRSCSLGNAGPVGCWSAQSDLRRSLEGASKPGRPARG